MKELMTRGRKESLKYLVLQENTWECWGVCKNFSFVRISYEYAIAARLKERSP